MALSYGQNATHVFFARNEVIDFVNPYTGKSWCFSQTLEEMKVRYPDAVIMEEAPAFALMDQAKYDRYHEAPTVITEDEFVRALECLPPMDWVQRSRSQSFKMSEFTCGDLTGIYAQVNEVFFRLCDRHTLTHDQIVALCTPGTPA